jgi:hypothetical protein
VRDGVLVTLTGKDPVARICVSALVMSGIEMASAQSQSNRPALVGSLGEKIGYLSD